MLTYVQKPLTTPRLRTVLAGIVPGVQRLGVDEDADEEPEAEEDLDEALEEWGAHGGWISKLFLIPFRISRFTLNQSRGFLPTWVLDMVGMIFGKPFKHR